MPSRRQPDQLLAQIAIDLYRALPGAERLDIAATMPAELGPAWLGHRTEPDEPAVTESAHAAHLARLVTERGHLSPVALPTAGLDAGHEPVEAALVRRRGFRAPRSAGTAPAAAQVSITYGKLGSPHLYCSLWQAGPNTDQPSANRVGAGTRLNLPTFRRQV